jgi:hypothetical protein
MLNDPEDDDGDEPDRGDQVGREPRAQPFFLDVA